MTDMMINKLPSKTWNWLKVNETKLPWDMEHTTVLPEAVSYTHLTLPTTPYV